MKNLKPLSILIILFLNSCGSYDTVNLKAKIESEFGLTSAAHCDNLLIEMDYVNNRIIHYYDSTSKSILFSDSIIINNGNIQLIHRTEPYTVLSYLSDAKTLIQIYFENCKNGIYLKSIKEISDSTIIFKEANGMSTSLYPNVSNFINKDLKKLKLYDLGINTAARSEYRYKDCMLNIQLVHYWMGMKSRASRYGDKDQEKNLVYPLSKNNSIYIDISILNRHDLNYDIQLDSTIKNFPKIKESLCN